MSERKSKIIPLLGIIPDVLIAEQFGLSRERVRQLRIERGIPIQYERKRRVEPRFAEEYQKVIESGLLGKKSDADIGKEFDLPTYMVFRLRRKLNIPKFKYRNLLKYQEGIVHGFPSAMALVEYVVCKFPIEHWIQAIQKLGHEDFPDYVWSRNSITSRIANTISKREFKYKEILGLKQTEINRAIRQWMRKDWNY